MIQHDDGDVPDVTISTKDEIAALAAISDPFARERAVEDFLRSRDDLFKRHAYSLMRKQGLGDAKMLDDIRQTVRVTAWQIVSKACDDVATLRKIRSTFEQYLYMQAREEVRRMLDNQGRDSVGGRGIVSAQRRHRLMDRGVKDLTAALHREPTVDEVVEHVNASLRATRGSKVDKQNILVSAADLVAPGQMVELAPEETLTSGGGVDFSDGFLLHPTEGRKVVAETISRCRDSGDEMLGRVASLWFADVYTTNGAAPGRDTTSHISATLGITTRQTGRYMARVRRTAMEYLQEAVGITSHDVA